MDGHIMKGEHHIMKMTNNTLSGNDGHLSLKLLINVSTLLSVAVATIIAFLIFATAVVTQRNAKVFNVAVLLTCNTCFAVICSSGPLTLMSLSSIGGDFDIYSLRSITRWACHTRGYLLFVFINSIYLSYVLQASFRLCRIAFYQFKCLRSLYIFVFYILLQWIISFGLIFPMIIIDNSLIVYLPDEFYCQVPMTSVRGIVFSILSIYFVPLCCICTIYVLIMMSIRRQSALMSLPRQRQNKRDALIFKRICTVVAILMALGIPSSMFVIVFIFTGHLHWAAYRIGWFSISLSLAFISLSSMYLTPQMRVIHDYLRRQHTPSNLVTASSSSSSTNMIKKMRNREKPLSDVNTRQHIAIL